jgi:hypothetical protein
VIISWIFSAKGRPWVTEIWARRILEAAINDMALVTLPVFCTLRMRRRMSLTLGIYSFPIFTIY